MTERDDWRIVTRDQNSILLDKGDYPRLFVDGVSHLSVGPAVSRIGYFRVASVEMKDNTCLSG